MINEEVILSKKEKDTGQLLWNRVWAEDSTTTHLTKNMDLFLFFHVFVKEENKLYVVGAEGSQPLEPSTKVVVLCFI